MTPLTEIVTWQGFTGFQGAKCSCGATHNLLSGIPGYICERCGKYNVLGWSGAGQFCHRKPDYGFKRSVIHWAIDNFCGWYKEHIKFSKKMKKMTAIENQREAAKG